MSAIPADAPRPDLRIVPPDAAMNGEQPPDSPGESAGGEQHARIPDAILYCAAIPVGARLLYGALQRHKGDKGCFPSVRTLAEELGVSTRSVDAWLDALIEAGSVTVDQQGGGRRSTRYELTGKVRSVVLGTTKPERRRTPPSVVPAATKDPRSVVLAAPQGGKICGAGGQQVQQSHSHVAKAIDPNDSAATQRDAPGKPAVPARAAPEPTNAPANDAAPSKPKRSASGKASADGGEQEHGARRAARPNGSVAGYSLMAWWCQEYGKRLEGDERRRAARAADDLLEQCGADADEAKAYVRYRYDQRWNFELFCCARQYRRDWREPPRRSSGARPGQMSVAGQQEVLDELLAEVSHDAGRDAQGAESALDLWPDERAEDQRGQGAGGQGIPGAGDGLPLRLGRRAGRAD